MTSPATQLEIAAQWLSEAADQAQAASAAFQFRRVAEDCLKVAGVKKKRKKGKQ